MSTRTGFEPAQVAGILLREGGICALSGATIGGAVMPRHQASTANHRLNRGQGGDPTRNGTDNGCPICNDCNDLIEVADDYGQAARDRGVKLREGDDPAQIPLFSPFYGQWVRLVGDAMFLTGITEPALSARDWAVWLNDENGEAA